MFDHWFRVACWLFYRYSILVRSYLAYFYTKNVTRLMPHFSDLPCQNSFNCGVLLDKNNYFLCFHDNAYNTDVFSGSKSQSKLIQLNEHRIDRVDTTQMTVGDIWWHKITAHFCVEESGISKGFKHRCRLVEKLIFSTFLSKIFFAVSCIIYVNWSPHR